MLAKERKERKCRDEKDDESLFGRRQLPQSIGYEEW
jgi:hypothetical protein